MPPANKKRKKLQSSNAPLKALKCNATGGKTLTNTQKIIEGLKCCLIKPVRVFSKETTKKIGSNYNFKRWTCPNLNVYEIFKGISIEC